MEGWVGLQTADPGAAKYVRLRDDRFLPRRTVGEHRHKEDATAGKEEAEKETQEKKGRGAN
jgi:hypothetical protein